jgi:hypothetical protein
VLEVAVTRVSLLVSVQRKSPRLIARRAVGRALCAQAVLLIACASVPKDEGPPPPRPEERSSLDVLLRHRSELQLTDDQIERLERLDDQREREVAALRTELAERKRAHQEGSGGAKGPASGSNAPPPGMSSRGMGGAGNRGRGMGGGMGRGQGSVAPRDPSEFERLHQKIDDADTRAFVDAHSMVLTQAQRPAAEKFASDYRAALFDYREEMRKRHPGLDPD